MSDQSECYLRPIKKPFGREALWNATVAYLSVWGMVCPNCAIRVRNAILALEGVLLADVDLNHSFAAVVYDPHLTTQKVLVLAVENAGNDEKHRYGAQVVGESPAAQVFAR